MVNLKRELRSRISSIKSGYTNDELERMSRRVIKNLEELDVYNNSKVVLLYYSMPDEVNTKLLISKNETKLILLPVVTKEGLILKRYESEEMMSLSNYGIKEPTGEEFFDYDLIDLVVVPGVAFDRTLSRMGRGMGYYDRLLPKINAPKVAICFDFQLMDNVPIDMRDIKMDKVVCENEVV